MNYLRAYLVLAALLTPTVAWNRPAVTDWRCEIVRPSPWDWLPQAAFLPSLGRHPLPKADR